VDLEKATIDAEKDDEVPEFLTNIEVYDEEGNPTGETVSIAEVLKEMRALTSKITTKYGMYAQKATIDFFSAFFGEDMKITLGKKKG